MPFYEIQYETGRMSVANYADDDEAKKAIGEHHRRAVAGEPGGPIGQAAERIRNVFVYDEHPDGFNTDQTMTKDVALKEVKDVVEAVADENGVINTQVLGQAVASLSHPFVSTREPFASQYKMKEDRALKLDFLNEAA